MATRERHLLAQPAATVVRHLARELLEDAQGAASRLDTDDTEALHDFRVAARRLRTLLRAYAELDRVPAKVVRRLRKLTRRTNEARDLEVALEHLRALAQEEPAATLVAARLETHFRHIHAETIAEVRERWPVVAERLHRALDRDKPSDALSFQAVTARLVTGEREQLTQRLESLRGTWQDEAAHRARLAGKRLRYLLEPLAAELPDARQAVTELKTFQDAFGLYHDLWVLLGKVAETAAEAAALSAHARVSGNHTLPPPVDHYLALAERLRADRRALAERLEAEYLSARPALLRPIDRTLEALTAP